MSPKILVNDCNFYVEKSKVQLYKIRSNGRCGWADITLDEGIKSGRISISCGWGNWSHYWPSSRAGFKKFLCGLNMDYVADKFKMDRYFNLSATIQEIKEEILAMRKREELSADDARTCWNFTVDFLASCCEGDPSEFSHMAQRSPIIPLVYELCPPFVYEIDPGFKRFWDTVWQHFIGVLKYELSTTVPATFEGFQNTK